METLRCHDWLECVRLAAVLGHTQKMPALVLCACNACNVFIHEMCTWLAQLHERVTVQKNTPPFKHVIIILLNEWLSCTIQ